jgi:hypothetical protein
MVLHMVRLMQVYVQGRNRLIIVSHHALFRSGRYLLSLDILRSDRKHECPHVCEHAPRPTPAIKAPGIGDPRQ